MMRRFAKETEKEQVIETMLKKKMQNMYRMVSIGADDDEFGVQGESHYIAMATATAPPSPTNSPTVTPRLGLAAPPVCRLGVLVADEEAPAGAPAVGVTTVTSVTVLTCP